MKCKYVFASLWVTVVLFLGGCSSLLDTQTENPAPATAASLKDGDYEKGVVTYVVDGDTFDVALENGNTERVRAVLINTPEICHGSSASDCVAEPYGDDAAVFAKELLEGETVYLEQDVSERDPYDRLLFYVYLEDGRMFQDVILREGLAEVAVYEPDVKHQAELEEAEESARSQHVNLWSNP